MKTALRLSLLLRRRRSGGKDPQRLTTVLAVVAFGSVTAFLLIVIGGVLAFFDRANAVVTTGGPPSNDSLIPVFALVAGALLLIPLTTLSGAAARLAVARRDERLAALRLAGATSGQVTLLALLDAGTQAILGALIGIAGYGALLPLVALLRFGGRRFEIGELWVGAPAIALAVLGIIVIALASALVSLRRVVITPLGVAARVTPPGMRVIRVFVMIAAFVATVIVANLSFGSEGVTIAVSLGMLTLGFATMNVVGPFVIWLIGRITAARARKVSTLLAGRRILDSPKTAWRSVGGVALATFIAGLTSLAALFDEGLSSNSADFALITDLKTGGFLTLAIAAVLAAVSTGVMQAGRVIDQRGEYRALVLAGSNTRTLDSARLRETLIPLVAAVGLATLAILMFMAPFLGLASFTNAGVVLQFLACVAGATVLVTIGAVAARLVVRTVVEI